MATTYTANPSGILPGQVVGTPITHLPWIFLCCQGERHCGWVKVANTPKQVVEVMAAKRRHEEGCQGGLIVPGVS